jgi:predicted RNase H-like nuclease (RuvC/YqgF family)
MQREIRNLKEKIEDLKEELRPVEELKMMTMSGATMLDGITKHISVHLMSQKIKELRKEFYSKGEFKNDSMKLLTKNDMEFLKKDNAGQFAIFAKEIAAFKKNESAFTNQMKTFQTQLVNFVERKEIRFCEEQIKLRVTK